MLSRVIVLGVAAALAAAAQGEPPKSPKVPVTDVHHGVKVVDDYRWLEDWGDAKVKAWSDAQNAHARSVLDALPGVDAIRARVTELRTASGVDYFALASAGGKLFALKNQPPKQQAMLVVMESPDHPDKERVIVDPNALSSAGTTAIDFFVPSLDGKKVAVSLSEGGSESGTVYVYDAAEGKRLDDVVPRVNGGTAGGSVSWDAQGTGFFYTRYPRGKERAPEDMEFYQQVFFHLLGTPTDSDRYEVGKDFPRIAEIALESREDGKYVIANVSNGDGGEHAFWVRTPEAEWKQVCGFSDGVMKVHFAGDDSLDLVIRGKHPRGRAATVGLDHPEAINAETLVLPGDEVVEDTVRMRDTLLIVDLAGGVSQIRRFAGREPVGPVLIPPVSSVEQLVRTGPEEALARIETYLQPPAWYRVKTAEDRPSKTALVRTSRADYSDCEVVRETAVSKDGTKVPVNIIRRKGTKLDGSNPTILYGYGGYGVSETPSFSETRKVWLEQGGVFAVANIRGGGEFGEEWHSQGNLTRKQNVFDDFHAAMTRLVELKYASPQKLALMGGSNGGLLMGAMLTQHPAEFRATSSAVGIYDMLRVELSPNGAFNVTEFGTVKDPEQFKAMFAYSPYHHVADGTSYPAVLFTTGANDPRVDPMQSRKMTARLQAAGAKTVLLRTSANAGHGIGSSLSERIEQDVDRYAFLFHELGVEYKPVTGAKGAEDKK